MKIFKNICKYIFHIGKEGLIVILTLTLAIVCYELYLYYMERPSNIDFKLIMQWVTLGSILRFYSLYGVKKEAIRNIEKQHENLTKVIKDDYEALNRRVIKLEDNESNIKH